MSKTYCVIARCAPGVDLALEVVEIGLRRGGLGMHFGIGGDGDVEIGDPHQPFDQLGGIVVAILGQLFAAGNVAAQGDDAPNAAVADPAGLGVDLRPARPDTGQVMRDGKAGARHHHVDDLGVPSRVVPPAP